MKAPALPDEYDRCIIGRSVSPYDDPLRLVYSLSGMLVVNDGDRVAVGNLMKKAFKQHGPKAPVFVNDEMPDITVKPEIVLDAIEIKRPE